MAREMKDSGIPWVGKIPAEWKSVPNKYVMFKVKVIQPVYKGEDILSLTMNGVIIRDLDAGGKMPSSFDGYQKLTPGNLLMCLFDYDVTPRCIGIIKNSGLTSPAYSQFVLKDNNIPGYYYFYYLMVDEDKCILPLAKNLRHSFTEEQLGIIKVPVPSIPEQKRIASYLNSKCSQIDALVADITKEIELLKEYRKSVIYEAVTKGLDPNVEMKDSGIEWVGKIPTNWTTKPLKNLFSFGKGLSITKSDLLEEGYPVISYGQIHAKFNTGVSIDCRLFRYVDTSYLKTDSASLVNPNSFVFADTSEDAEGCGNCVYNDTSSSFFAGYHTIILKPKLNKNYKYLAYLFQTDIWRNQIRNRIVEVKLFTISQKLLKLSSVIIPSEIEQNRIVEHLDKKCSQIDSIISEKEQQIKKLTEYKKSLIYEYVTGKKEVPAV